MNAFGEALEICTALSMDVVFESEGETGETAYSHFDVLMVLLGIRRLVVQRL